MIPYGRQTIDEEDVSAVAEALKSDFLTTGPKVKEFENKFAKYVKARYAVAVSSGTAALHLACLAANIKTGDEVITTPMTFVASANCALYSGAKPVFVDINEHGLIDENKIEEKITHKTKIIIPVNYAGLSCNMEKIREIADNHNLMIIEDSCHAFGGKYKNSMIGKCKYSDMCIFSFYPVKHITTGEGGMITTNSKGLYEKLIMLRTHGITKNPKKFNQEPDGSWHQEMHFLGYNYRITDFQCVLGISQLNKINTFVKKRRELAKNYDEAFKNNKGIEIIKEKKEQFNPYHLYIIKVKDSITRRRLYDYLLENKIKCQVHYIPVYWHPYYQKLGYKKGTCPKAEEFYQKVLSIPIFPTLKVKEQNYVISKISKII